MVKAGFWSSKSLLADVEVLGRCSLFSDASWIPTDRYTEKGSLGSSRTRSMQSVLESGPRPNTQHG